MSNIVNLIDKKFGQLVVVIHAGESSSGRPSWECLCSCGNRTVVIHGHLISGNTKSCGCLQRKMASKINTTHGHTKEQKWSKQYRTWVNMIQRCASTSSKNRCYKEQKISVCERWKQFKYFLADIGEPPTDKYQIDRIDNSQGYCKTNCRWVTPKQNGRNKRNNHLLTLDGVSKCLSQWAEEIDIPYCTLKMRIRRGWSAKRALTTPVLQRKRNQKHV